jgi:hypothetical protein
VTVSLAAGVGNSRIADGDIARTHPGPVARALGQGGPSGLNQARQHQVRLAFPDRDDPRDQPAVFGHVDGLAVPDPGQHLTRVVPGPAGHADLIIR